MPTTSTLFYATLKHVVCVIDPSEQPKERPLQDSTRAQQKAFKYMPQELIETFKLEQRALQHLFNFMSAP